MNMLALLAQGGGGFIPGGIGGMLIYVVVIAAAVGIVFIACRAFGVAIPPWVIQIGWICIVALVAVFAIRFVLSL